VAGRIRSVKPEWIEDEKMVLASPAARTMSIGLILLADDYGRGVGNRDLIVSRVFPAHHREGHEALEELLRMGFIRFYEVRDQIFFEIVNWDKHQKVQHPGKPRVPAPSEGFWKVPETLTNVPEILMPDHDHDHDHDQERDPHAPPPQLSLRTPSPAKKKNGVHRSLVSPSQLTELYEFYPRKQDRANGIRAAKKAIRTVEDYEACRKTLVGLAQAWKGTPPEERKFLPYFSTYVNGRRWEDEEQPRPDGAPKTAEEEGYTFAEEVTDDF